MKFFHEKTNITVKSAFEQNTFIDWRTQPKSFKTYPKFFRRYSLDEYEELTFIKNFGKITMKKKYGKEEINLRTNPSAGALYPCEIYIQIRGIKKILSGIYHYEPLNNTLVLIHELSNDGLEYYFKDKKQQKFIFLISNVYFRSSWKYDKRAIRYLLLDTGHQIASIFASLKLENKHFKIDLDFDKNILNETFGFDGFEFFQASIISEVYKEKQTKELREKLVNVSACDYQKKDYFIEEFSKKTTKEKTKELILLPFLEDLTKEGIKQGVYKNVSLLKEGDYTKTSRKLSFNQKLGGDSAFTLFFTSKNISHYIKNYILCGFLAHIINLRASHLNLGCTGIGAYFDDECQNFFETKNNILYLQALGR